MLLKRGFKVNSDTAKWYRGNQATDFGSSEKASPVL